jgi:flagellar biosynthesis/type III secretory pathway chaperone
VRNSAVLQELTFQKRALLARLGELSQGKVRDLRLRVGEFD